MQRFIAKIKDLHFRNKKWERLLSLKVLKLQQQLFQLMQQFFIRLV